MKKETILLFISEALASHHAVLGEFKKLTEQPKMAAAFSFRVIDVIKKPELAEKHKVEALPTLIVGKVRIVGKPDVARMERMILEDKEDRDFMKNYKG